MKLDHLSYSSVSCYLDCSLSWKYRYVDEIKTPTAHNLVLGSAWHDMAEAYAKGQTNNLEQAFTESLMRRVAGERIKFTRGATANDLKEKALDLLQNPDVRVTLDELRALTDPTVTGNIERKITLTVPNVPVPVIGYIDVLQKDGIPADLKTTSSKKGWTLDKAQREKQPLVYLGALEQAGLEVPEQRFRHYTFNFTTGEAAVFDVPHTWDQIWCYMDLIQGVWHGIKQEVYLPHTGSWKCNPQWCDYWNICQEH
jgi:putative RecB family exonuclease